MDTDSTAVNSPSAGTTGTGTTSTGTTSTGTTSTDTTGTPTPTGSGAREPPTPPGELYALWAAAVARSRAAVATALTRDGLGQLTARTSPDGQAPSLRRILIDMIEEYARHVGHADLIRESVDGLTGEDPG